MISQNNSQQTLLFTVIPRGLSLDADPLPVSVVVSPRLGGSEVLGDFPDWLEWTSRLKSDGLSLDVRCAGRTQTVQIDTAVLAPELWAELFDAETFVEPFSFPDYAERGVLSFSMRESLSALKNVYQQAGLELALPVTGEGDQIRKENRNRNRLRELVQGFEVHWNARVAASSREAVRRKNRYTEIGASGANLDAEGLIRPGDNAGEARKDAALPFAVFHHMPTPDREGAPLELDRGKVLDFHRVVSSLGAYPELQRKLGLVFDLELPAEFVARTEPEKFETLSIGAVHADWRTATKTPEVRTAYVHLATDGGRLFTTAPRGAVRCSSPTNVVGLLDLNPARFGLAQVDVEGGMHKAIILAETLIHPDRARNLDHDAKPEPAPHPEVFDPGATLPSLRSGGFSLYVDQRGAEVLRGLQQAKKFNDAAVNGSAQPEPFFAEDLVRGYRLDVWDSHTGDWHSLHLRDGKYQIGDETFTTEAEEGFTQLAFTQPAPGAESPDPEATRDLYIHEALARWAGWSLSAPRPARHLNRSADPAKALEEEAGNQAETPFDMTVEYTVTPGTLPRLRFGTRYRVRARALDFAGSGLALGALADSLAHAFALPRDPEGFAYLRYEPVIAPLLVMRDAQAVTSPGSAIDRLVIRTFNETTDDVAADTTAAERHVVPPRTSVEMGERLGIFDDAAGKMKTDAATWKLIGERDAGELEQVEIEIAKKADKYPIAAADQIAPLPYLPDPLSRGAALRDLPGTPGATLGKAAPGPDGTLPIAYSALEDANPRPGSATLIGFGTSGDWEETRGFRLVLAEPAPGEKSAPPVWDATERVLTVFLAKGETAVVPLSSYMERDDLALMGVWQWLREYIERVTIAKPPRQSLRPGGPDDEIAHILQRVVEGGHWMLTPPRLLTLVHAVQKPIGRPEFAALEVAHTLTEEKTPLETAASAGRTDPAELAPITAWRRPGSTDAYLLGALRVHGASTAKVDLHATWDDPIDDEKSPEGSTIGSQSAQVEELPLPAVREDYLIAPGADRRAVAYYDPEHDQMCFVRRGDASLLPGPDRLPFYEAAPRHQLGDSKHHRVTYTASATSRYREYFKDGVDFTKKSEAVVVDVPASSRPLAASVAYVLPTFGWERQTDTNLKRSVRFGGGLRVYLHRPWFSSGEGELLGVALWSYDGGAVNEASRDRFKSHVTQWGMDPIWQSANLKGVPWRNSFPDAVATDAAVSLEEKTGGAPANVDVVGFPVHFDPVRKLWFADLTVDLPAATYMPFIRLALVRYQPHALADAKISRIVLADFAQLTPDRSAMVTVDPHHPRTVRVVVSGVAPRGPVAVVKAEPRPAELAVRPTQVRVRLQERDPAITGDLAWRDAPESVAEIKRQSEGPAAGQPDIALWEGAVLFTEAPEPGHYRLLIEEHEYISARYTIREGNTAHQPGRLIYAETIALDTPQPG